MEEQVAVVDHQNQEECAINKVSKSEIEEETLINFLDSVDDYLVLIDSLSNTLLRQVLNSSLSFLFNKGGVYSWLMAYLALFKLICGL